jgi:hypothetical protein
MLGGLERSDPPPNAVVVSPCLKHSIHSRPETVGPSVTIIVIQAQTVQRKHRALRGPSAIRAKSQVRVSTVPSCALPVLTYISGVTASQVHHAPAVVAWRAHLLSKGAKYPARSLSNSASQYSAPVDDPRNCATRFLFWTPHNASPQSRVSLA